MNVRAVLALVILFGLIPLRSEESDVFIVRDLLVPPSLFEEAATGKRTDPRERLADEGITFDDEDSVAHDPVTSRLFVRADAMTILRIEKLIEAEMAKGLARVVITYQVLETRKPLLSETDAPPGEPQRDPDSGARVIEGGKVVEPVNPALFATKIFATGDQVDSLILRVRAADLGTIRAVTTVVARSGETTEAWIGDALTRNVPMISADASTVGMTLTLFQGRAGADPQIVGETKLSVFSGGTVAFEEQLGEGSWRTRLITVVVVDAAGNPIPRRETKGLPGEERRGPSGSLFPGPVPEPAIEKVKTIIIPSVEFKETPLIEAIEMLNQASIEHDKSLPESQRGVRIRFLYADRSGIELTPVTLRLSNVPLGEAIRYTAGLSGCEYRIEGGTVMIGPEGTTASGGAGDIWYTAFLREKEAEETELSGKPAEAAAKRLQAMKLYEVLGAKYPEFHPGAVRERIRKLKERLEPE